LAAILAYWELAVGFPAGFALGGGFDIRNEALGGSIGLVALFGLVGGPCATSAHVVSWGGRDYRGPWRPFPANRGFRRWFRAFGGAY
jgi:hypothetical protein